MLSTNVSLQSLNEQHPILSPIYHTALVSWDIDMTWWEIDQMPKCIIPSWDQYLFGRSSCYSLKRKCRCWIYISINVLRSYFTCMYSICGFVYWYKYVWISLVCNSLKQWDKSEDRIALFGLGFSAVVAVWASSNLIGVIILTLSLLKQVVRAWLHKQQEIITRIQFSDYENDPICLFKSTL